VPEFNPDDLFRGLDPEVKEVFQGEVAQQRSFLNQVSPRAVTQKTSIIGPGVYVPKSRWAAYDRPGRPVSDITLNELETRHRLNSDPAQTASIVRQAGVFGFKQALHWLDDADEAWKVTIGRVPDKEAKIQFYARLLPEGLGEDFVRDNFTAVERDFLYRDFRELMKDSKALAQWAANPHNMTLAWDSGRQLTALKNVLVSRYGGAGEHIGVGFENALEGPRKGLLGFLKAADDIATWLQRKTAEFERGEDFTPEEAAAFDKRWSHVANVYLLSLLGDSDAQKEVRKLDKMTPQEMDRYLAGRQDILSAEIRSSRDTASALTDEVGGFYRFAVDLPGSAADLLSKVAMGSINPAIPLGLVGIQEGGSVYADLRDEGISSGAALGVSVPVAAINTLLERATLGNVRNILGIRERLSREALGTLIREVVVDVVENIGQETLQNMVSTAGTLGARATKEDFTVKQILNEMFGSFKEGLYEGLLVGTSSALLGIGSVATGMRRVAMNARQRAALSEISKILEETPLAVRDPEKLQQAIDAMVAGTNPNQVIRDVGIDAETFMQLVPEAIQKQTLQALGLDEQTFNQALAENEEIRFTIGAWATIAPTQIGTDLFNHLRFGADGMTVAEQVQAMQFEIDVATDRALIFRDMMTTSPKGMSAEQRLAYQRQFEETGMPASYARDYVELLDRVLKRGARIKGTTAEALAERVRFTIDADPNFEQASEVDPQGKPKTLFQLTNQVFEFARETTGLSEQSEQVIATLDRLADFDRRLQAAVGAQITTAEELRYRLKTDPQSKAQLDKALELAGEKPNARVSDALLRRMVAVRERAAAERAELNKQLKAEDTTEEQKTQLEAKIAELGATINAIGPITGGHGRPSAFQINKVLAKDKALRAEIEQIQADVNEMFGSTTLINDQGIVTLGIERRMKKLGPEGEVDPYKPQFGGFRRSFAQTFMDYLPDAVFEAFREEVTIAVEAAYLANTEMEAPIKFVDQPISNVAKTDKGVALSLKRAEKTGAALNLNSACPMFMIGSHGCYFDGCYVTGMGMGGNTISFYSRAAYTGEILQLSQESIDLLNSVGGLRVNGQGDLTDRQYGQLRDVVRHADMRGLKLKIITKQDATFRMLAQISNEGISIEHVLVQPSLDPYWIPIQEDELADSFASNLQLSRALEGESDNTAIQQAIIDLYAQQGREAKVIDGKLYRKYGYSVEKYEQILKDYPQIRVLPRIVVGTAEEIVQYAREHPEMLQTWMHAAIRPGMYSDTVSRVLGEGEIGNFTARIAVVQDEEGEWHVFAQERTPPEEDKAFDLSEKLQRARREGRFKEATEIQRRMMELVETRAKDVPTKVRAAYQRVEEYIKAQPDAQKIFQTLAGTLDSNPGSLCCAAGADKDACNNCTSSCHMSASLSELPQATLEKTPAVASEVAKRTRVIEAETFGQAVAPVGEVDTSVSFETVDVPPENTAFTQITTTVGTYRAAGEKLKTLGLSEGTVLDFGAGKGVGTKELGPQAEAFEPFPGADYEPDYTDVPKKKYGAVVSLNVLNVLPPAERQVVIENIGNVLRVGGTALIGTRGRGVAKAKNKTAVAGDPGGFIIQPNTDRRRYQKGFTNQSLAEEVQAVLGVEYEVTPTKIGSIPAAVQVKRLTAAETRERAETFQQQRRGAVTFTGQDIHVRLFQGNWDTSTPVHELGHIALKFLQEAVESGTADEALLAEYEELQRFAGGQFNVEGIEKIINEWEAYFMEGKAPAVELTDSFTRFKNWMLDIYKDISTKLGGREGVAPEMRQIFGAWLATEQEAEVAEAYYRTYEAASDILLNEKDAKIEKARKKAEDEKERRVREAVQTRVKEWRDQTGGRIGIVSQAVDEIDALPTYQALKDAQEQGGINPDDLASFFTGAELGQLIAELRGKHGQGIVAEQAQQPSPQFDAFLNWSTDVDRRSQLETLADKYGFEDPHQMVLAMKDAVNRDQAIEDRANQIEARHIRNIKAAVETGVETTHSEATFDLIQRDINRLEALARGQEKAREPQALRRAKMKALRDQAREDLRKTVNAREAMQFRKWAAREAEYARKAIAAARRGDAKAALEARRRQLKFHALILESVKLREHYESIRRKLAGKTLNGRLKNTQPDYARAVRDLAFAYRVNDTTVPERGTVSTKQEKQEDGSTLHAVYDGETRLGVFSTRGEALATWRAVVQAQPLELPSIGLKEGEDADLRGLLVDLNDTVPTWVKEKQVPVGYMNMKDLTFEQIDDLNATIQMLLHEGGQYLNALKALGVERVAELVTKINSRLEKLPNFKQGTRDSGTTLGKADGLTAQFAAYMTRMEFLFDAMDGYVSLKGEKTGPAGLIYDLISLADANYDNMLAKHMEGGEGIPGLQQAFVRLAKAAEQVHAKRGQFFDVPGVPIPPALREIKGWEAWTFERILCVVLNMGNDANRGPLQKSVYQFSDEQLDSLVSVLPADALRAVQDVWDSIDVYSDLARVSEAVTFKRPPKEEPQPFVATSAEGEQILMRGGYYPLRYDSDLDPDAGRWNERSNILADLYNRATYTSARPDATASKARVRDERTGESLSTRPPDLSLGVLVDRFTKTVRQITHTELLYDLQRLTTNKDFYEAFVAKFGLPQYKALRGWLNRTARPERKLQGPMNRAVEQLRALHTVSALGLRVLTSGKQALSAANAVQAMNDSAQNLSGYKYIAYGASTLLTGDKDMGKSPGKIIEFIHSVDPFMKARSRSITREMRDFTRNIDFARGGFLNKIKRTRQWCQEIAFLGIRAVDAVTTYSVWLGAYKQALELGLEGVKEATTPEEAMEAAVRYARRIVRTTQPSGMPTDQSAVQADEGAVRLLTQFMSFKSVDFNRFMHRVAGIKRGQISAKSLGSYIINERILPAMAMLIPAFIFYNEDERPKWWEFLFQPGTDLLGGVPGLNLVARTFEYGPAELPITQGVTRAARAVKKFRSGKIGEGAFETWRTLEWFTGVPFSNPISDARRLYKKVKEK